MSYISNIVEIINFHRICNHATNLGMLFEVNRNVLFLNKTFPFLIHESPRTHQRSTFLLDFFFHFFKKLQCNLDLVTLKLVTTCNLGAILQRTIFGGYIL